MIRTLKRRITKHTLKITMLFSLTGLLAVLPAIAQEKSAPTTMKPTVVTGSLIPTAETVGPSPIQSLSTTQIEQAGTADTLLTLKQLVPGFTGAGNYLGSVNNNVNLGAGFQAFTGESYAALRNLPTLVLLDGQRICSSALSGAQAVDLNTIPLAMIDRIEVLKDGASAIYGSDAIGGVINIIPKKDWNGVEISGRYGFPTQGPGSDGSQYQASIVAGLATDTSRFVAGAQYFVQNELLTKDRNIGSMGSAELINHNLDPNGAAYISPSFPGKVAAGGETWILAGSPFAAGAPGYNPAVQTPPIIPGRPAFTGANSIVNYNQAAIANGYVDPTGHGRGPYIPFATTPTGQQLASLGLGEPWSALNTTDFGTASILGQQRSQFWANFDHDLFKDTMVVYASFLYSDNQAQGALAPSPVPGLTPSLSNISVPGNNYYNPFGIDLGGSTGAGTPRVRSRFVEFGNRDFDSFSDFWQFVGGLKGKIIEDLTYNLSYEYSQDRQDQQTRNAVNGAGLDKALVPLLDGAGSQVFNAQGLPLSVLQDANGNNVPQYNMFFPSLATTSGANSLQTINLLRATLFTTGQSEQWTAQGVFNYALPYALPAGKINLAAGGQYIDENISIQVDGLTSLNLVPGLNAGAPFSGGSRTMAAGFLEATIPVTSKDMNIPGMYSFDIDAAGRYQTFNPGGDALVPKVAVRWQPLDDQFTIRGGYNQGFIAPSIFNLFGPDFLSNPAITLQNPDGSLTGGQVTTVTRANPDLKPSNSEQWGIGAVISPKNFVKDLTFSADYYHVTENNLPIADAQSVGNSLNALGSQSPYYQGFTFADGSHPDVVRPHEITVDTWGQAIIPWQSAGALKTSGFDFAGNYVLPFDQEKYGRFTINAVANLTMSYEVQMSPANGYYPYQGTWTTQQGLIPNYNLTTSLAYDLKDWTYVITAHYLPFTIAPGGLFPDPAIYTGVQGFTINNPTHPWGMQAYFTIDMQLSYEFGKHKTAGRQWYDGTRLTVGCQNVTGSAPVLIAGAVEDNTDKNNYSILGQFVYMEVSKKF